MNELTPTERSAPNKHLLKAFGFGVLGALTLAASLALVAGAANAGTEPIDPPVEPEDPTESVPENFVAYEQCISDHFDAAGVEDPFLDPEIDPDFDPESFDWEAIDEALEAADEACGELLPEDIQAHNEAFAAYDECVSNQVAEAGVEDPFLDPEIDPDFDPESFDWEAIDEALEAADKACGELLPEDIRAEMEAFEPFEQCISEIDEGTGFGQGVVWVDAASESTAVQFSDEPGIVTISGTADAQDVQVSGGVTVLTDTELDTQFAELDAQFSACDDLLPEDAFELPAEVLELPEGEG